MRLRGEIVRKDDNKDRSRGWRRGARGGL